MEERMESKDINRATREAVKGWPDDHPMLVTVQDTGCGFSLAELKSLVTDLEAEIVAERERREELEVVAAAFYLGHDDATEKFDMYRTVYLSYGHDNTPAGFEMCTREVGHTGPCALKETNDA